MSQYQICRYGVECVFQVISGIMKAKNRENKSRLLDVKIYEVKIEKVVFNISNQKVIPAPKNQSLLSQIINLPHNMTI